MLPARMFSASLLAGGGFVLALQALHAQTAGQKLPQEVIDMVNAQIQWDVGLMDQTRPHLEFVKFDEFSRSDGHFTRFRIFARGVSEKTQYSMVIWKIGTPIQNLQ